MAQRQRTQRGSKSRLGSQGRLRRGDWIKAGFELLGEAGVEGVRVEPLADRLGITKGSFYWHFNDRKALLEGCLAYWEERETAAIIRRVDAGGGSPDERLRRLFDEALADRDGLAPELAVRHWARHDRRASTAVRTVDEHRLAYIEGFFRELGCAASDAKRRAALYYGLLIGEWTIFRPETAAQRRDRQKACLDYLIP